MEEYACQLNMFPPVRTYAYEYLISPAQRLSQISVTNAYMIAINIDFRSV